MAKLADVIAQNGPERNWDEETLAQQREIEDEIAKAQPFVGEKQPLAALESEYNEKESGEYLRKAKELRELYPDWRRVRGDGNCFYRAVAFAQLERLLQRDNPAWKTNLEQFREMATKWKERLLKLEYPAMTTEDFCDVFSDIIKQLEQDDANEEKLLKIFNTQGESEYIVVFMRLPGWIETTGFAFEYQTFPTNWLPFSSKGVQPRCNHSFSFSLVTGGYLLENEATYGGFVDGDRSIRQYVEQEVNPMNRECDHLCIIALSKALNIPIRIEYMDRSQAPAGGWHHDFNLEGHQKPSIFFLYRPGHYDILYPK